MSGISTVSAYLLRQKVTIKPLTINGEYGPSHGSGSEVIARFEPDVKVLKRSDSKEDISLSRVILNPNAQIDTSALITYEGKDYRVHQIKRHPNPFGKIHHIEVMVK